MNDLTEHPKRNPYKAPEGYFEQLPLRLQQRLEKNDSRISLPWFLKWQWQTAFLLLLTLGIGLWMNLPTRQQALQTETILASLPNEAIVSYFEDEQLGSVSMAEIASDAPVLEPDEYLQSIDEESLYLELEDDVPALTKEDLSL